MITHATHKKATQNVNGWWLWWYVLIFIWSDAFYDKNKGVNYSLIVYLSPAQFVNEMA
jgi:hypothetical protein